MNRVILMGRLGETPDLVTLTSGVKVARMRLATKGRRKQGDEWVEEAEWHTCTAFGREAETMARYLTKGAQVLIEGRLHTTQWEKDGQRHERTEVMVERFEFTGDGKRQESRRREEPAQDEGWDGAF